MRLNFVSSLSPEDELLVSQAVLAVLASALDHLPLTYTLRIESGSRVFEHSHAPSVLPGCVASPVAPAATG